MAYYLNWNAVPNADRYEVAYSATATGEKTLLAASPIYATKADLTEITETGTRYLFVRARGAGYTDSDWSAPFEFSLVGLSASTSFCTISFAPAAILKGAAYTATVTADEGYYIAGGGITVRMGGVDITSSAVSGGVITIPNVTGAVQISATATAVALASPVITKSAGGGSISWASVDGADEYLIRADGVQIDVST